MQHQKQSLCQLYRMNSDNIRRRVDFAGLTPSYVRSLASLANWGKRYVPRIAKEFYDFQFSFPESRRFFEEYAKKRGVSLDELRNTLEKAQTRYLTSIFEAAANNDFGTAYFENRLFVGQVHNKIDLPPKWYIGSYPLFFSLFRRYIWRSYFYRPRTAFRAEQALLMVFNLDIQAISDSFTLDMMESAGMDLVNVPVADGKDLTEYIGYIKNAFADEIATIAGALEQGDLTISIEPRSDKDIIRVALKDIVSSQRTMIRQLRENGEHLKATAEILSRGAEESGEATGQIAHVIQEMTMGLNQQAENSTSTAVAMHSMNELIQDVGKSSKEQYDASSHVLASFFQISKAVESVALGAQSGAERALDSSQKAGQGASAVEENIQTMASIREKVGISAQKVEEMGRQSKQIGSIVETIDEIANQTNLLALNAAIEAARAGTHGKGFAVVADEVRKLAEKSTVATREIGQLVQSILSTVEDAVSAMNIGAKEVQVGMEGVTNSGKVFQEILRAVEGVGQQVESIAASAQEMNATNTELAQSMHRMSELSEANLENVRTMAQKSDEVLCAVEQIAAVSEENGAASEEVSATTEELSAQSAEVARSANELNSLSKLLLEQIQRFKLPEENDTPLKLRRVA